MIRRLLMLPAVLAVLAALTWALWPKPLVVETGIIERRTIEVRIEDEGKSRIREVFTVSAAIAGRLMRIDLHAGDEVTANQTVVASLRPVEPGLLDVRSRKIAEATVDAASAAVDFASAQLDQAKAQLEFFNDDLTRATQLVRRGTIAQRTYDKAKVDAAVGKAAVESANANLQVRKQELESARAQLIEGETGGEEQRCCVEVKAPVSGRVLRVVTESEQVVPAGTTLVELGDPTDIEIEAEFLSRDAVKVKAGAEARVESWGGPELRAKVDHVDPAAVTKVSALGIEEQRVTVVLKLLDPPEVRQNLGHGFRVVASILIWRGENLVAVPIGALFRQGSDWAVFVAEGGVAGLRKVELGERNSDFAEVKSGLKEGETVILHPSDRVVDGSSVISET